MRFVGEVEETGEDELEQALSNGKVIATVRNDLSDISYTVTGYSAKTGKEIWTRTGEGWLSCAQSSPIVCQTTSYRQGVRTIEEASVLSLDKGKMTKLEVGKGGKFEFAGTYDDAAYFLTWQGTDDIHMTSFDDSGAPLTDKNLQAPAPKKASDSTVSVDMSGPFASVRTESTSGVYVAGRNGYQEIPVVGPCMALRDGAVCQSKTGLTAVGPDSTERWSIETDIKIVASTRTMDIKLAEAKKRFEGSLADSLQDSGDLADDSGDGEDGAESGEDGDTGGRSADSDGGDADGASAAGTGSGRASARNVNATESTGTGNIGEGARGNANGNVSGNMNASWNVNASAVGKVGAAASEKAGTLRADGSRPVEGGRQVVQRQGEVVKASKSEPDPSQSASPSDARSTAPSRTAAPSRSTAPGRNTAPSPSASTSAPAEPSSPAPKQSGDVPDGATSETGKSPSTSPSSDSPEVASPSAPRPLDARVLIATEEGPGVAAVEGGILTLSDGRVVDLEGGTLVGLDLSHEIAVVDVEHRTPKGGENGGVAVVSSILVGGDGTVLARVDSSESEKLATDGAGGDLFRPFGFAWQRDVLVFVDAVGRKIGVYEPEDK